MIYRQMRHIYNQIVPCPIHVTESDEMFQNAGEKGMTTLIPMTPRADAANKRRGRGTYANDRPPILGTVGRENWTGSPAVVDDTKKATLSEHVHRLIHEQAMVNTDEYQSYNGVQRDRETVCHGAKEYARDDDGDGFCEMHCNTVEGM